MMFYVQGLYFTIGYAVLMQIICRIRHGEWQYWGWQIPFLIVFWPMFWTAQAFVWIMTINEWREARAWRVRS